MYGTHIKEGAKSLFGFFCCKPKESRIDTLTAFMRDSEHEMMAVLTALQAQIDLLHDELRIHKMPRDRFAGLNRSVSRLIADTYALSAMAELSTTPPSKNKVLLQGLMDEVVAEAHAEISSGRVSVSCAIASGTILLGDTVSLKHLCQGLLAVVLQKCQALDTVTIVGLTQKKLVYLSFETGAKSDLANFKPWRVGQLHHVPSNGDGIKLAAIDAMARMHQGQLDVCRLPETRDSYRLILKS